MKTSLMILLALSTSTFAGTTCPKSTKPKLTCTTFIGQQIDVCQKKNSSHQIRINGEVYSQTAQFSRFDGLIRFQGKNYDKTRFIVEVDPKSGTGSLTEINQFDMPVSEPMGLKYCK